MNQRRGVVARWTVMKFWSGSYEGECAPREEAVKINRGLLEYDLSQETLNE